MLVRLWNHAWEASMEVRTLRYFLAVADAGSVTAASARVLVAQPSISRQLRSLEAELGVELFLREGRRMRLSPAGKRFLPIVRDLVARADSARATMTALASGVQVPVSVAAHPTTISDVIAPFVARSGPGSLIPTFVPASADGAYERLARAEVDVAISAARPPQRAELILVARFPIWAQVPDGHPSTTRSAPLAITDLVGERLIVLDATHATRRTFDEEVSRAGLVYEPAAVVGLPRIAQALAASGAGIAIVTDDPTYGLRGIQVEGRSGPLQIMLHAAWDRTHYAGSVIRAYVEALAAHCAG